MARGRSVLLTAALAMTALLRPASAGRPESASPRGALLQPYGQLRYNEVAMKAAHNSYQRDETLTQQLEWNPAQPFQAGCRGVELDISQSNDGGAWSVGHKDSYDPHYRQLSQFLSELAVWFRQNRRHDPITVHLDLKHVVGDFPRKLDDYIRAHLQVGIVTAVYRPGELMGNEPNLAAGAQKNGWPTIDQLRGKFLFVVTGGAQAKDRYSRTAPRERLCFADKDVSDTDRNVPNSDACVFFNYNLYTDHRGTWGPVFRRMAGSRKHIIRGYVLDGDTLWNAALSNGCHVLATNKVRNYSWARVGAAPFVKLPPL